MNMKLSRLVSSGLCIVAILSLLGGIHTMPVSGETRGVVRYVKGGGTGDCSSWENACDLRVALGVAVAGNEVWVAAATYSPSFGDSTISFNLKSGVAIYGGFPVSGGDWTSRNPMTNVTTLTGEIWFDNSYHVVNGSGVDDTAVLDGFTITKGMAMGTSANQGGGMYILGGSPTLTNLTFTRNEAGYGGGMYIDNSTPTLTNVTFSENEASSGGGMYNRNGSSPIMTNVTFSSNTATGFYCELTCGGGGMLNYESSPTLTNVTFSGNTTTYGIGGGMLNYKSSPTLTNVTFFGNTAPDFGGGMYNTLSQPIMINSIMWGNTAGSIYNSESAPVITYSDIEGVYTGTGNISLNPHLGPLADNGGFTQTHKLGWGSPAIDSGSLAICPATDQRGVARPVDGNVDGISICDMGAYEYVPYYSYLPLIVK